MDALPFVSGYPLDSEGLSTLQEMNLRLRQATPWALTPEEYTRLNPHSATPRGMPYDVRQKLRARLFDSLPPDAPVWVFHNTDNTPYIDVMMQQGVNPANKPMTAPRIEYELTGHAWPEVGGGLSGGTYVANSPLITNFYGKNSLAIRAPKNALTSPPEATRGPYDSSVGRSVISPVGAVITSPILPEQVLNVTPTNGTVNEPHPTFIQYALRAGEHIPYHVAYSVQGKGASRTAQPTWYPPLPPPPIRPIPFSRAQIVARNALAGLPAAYLMHLLTQASPATAGEILKQTQQADTDVTEMLWPLSVPWVWARQVEGDAMGSMLGALDKWRNTSPIRPSTWGLR